MIPVVRLIPVLIGQRLTLLPMTDYTRMLPQLQEICSNGHLHIVNEQVIQEALMKMLFNYLIGDPNGTLTSQGTFTSAADASWTMHTGQYVVPAGQTTTRLTFTVLRTASGSTSSGNFIDQVQLYSIPSGCEDYGWRFSPGLFRS